jgi:hypothetical protein
VRKEDEAKTSFVTPFGTYCFVRMPEGLKNASYTVSRMIAIVLHPQLRRNILAYVDDIIVKSVQRDDHISDLQETFANPRAANLNLNPEKCVFGIHKGKVLGCLVSTKGIEANPDKIKALVEMQDPVSVKDVQKLTGRVPALNRFIVELQREVCLFSKFSKFPRIFSGLNLRNKPSKNSKITCQT